MNATDEIRVLHVMEAMVRGGAESLIIEHVRCAGPDVRVFVCALNREGPALEAAERAGATIVRLGRVRGLARVRALAARIRAARINVVSGHNPTGSLYATLAGRLAGVGAILRTEHSLHYRGRHSNLYPLIESVLTLMTRRVVCVCRAVLESHASRLAWAARRFVIVANGISSASPTRAREAVRAELGIAIDSELILSVGSLTVQKAQHVMVDAFARVHRARPGARLVIAGDGPREAELGAQVRALGLTGMVHLIGPRADVADLVEACDVFVLSSVREGLPITLLEAMRGARPAVVTRIGGMPDVVEDGRTGCIVPPGDPAAMGAAIENLLSDPAMRRAMGLAAAARWQTSFTAERMVASTEAVYREALANRAPEPRNGKARHATH